MLIRAILIAFAPRSHVTVPGNIRLAGLVGHGPAAQNVLGVSLSTLAVSMMLLPVSEFEII